MAKGVHRVTLSLFKIEASGDGIEQKEHYKKNNKLNRYEVVL